MRPAAEDSDYQPGSASESDDDGLLQHPHKRAASESGSSARVDRSSIESRQPEADDESDAEPAHPHKRRRTDDSPPSAATSPPAATLTPRALVSAPLTPLTEADLNELLNPHHYVKLYKQIKEQILSTPSQQITPVLQLVNKVLHQHVAQGLQTQLRWCVEFQQVINGIYRVIRNCGKKSTDGQYYTRIVNVLSKLVGTPLCDDRSLYVTVCIDRDIGAMVHKLYTENVVVQQMMIEQSCSHLASIDSQWRHRRQADHVSGATEVHVASQLSITPLMWLLNSTSLTASSKLTPKSLHILLTTTILTIQQQYRRTRTPTLEAADELVIYQLLCDTLLSTLVVLLAQYALRKQQMLLMQLLTCISHFTIEPVYDADHSDHELLADAARWIDKRVEDSGVKRTALQRLEDAAEHNKALDDFLMCRPNPLVTFKAHIASNEAVDEQNLMDVEIETPQIPAEPARKAKRIRSKSERPATPRTPREPRQPAYRLMQLAPCVRAPDFWARNVVPEAELLQRLQNKPRLISAATVTSLPAAQHPTIDDLQLSGVCVAAFDATKERRNKRHMVLRKLCKRYGDKYHSHHLYTSNSIPGFADLAGVNLVTVDDDVAVIIAFDSSSAKVTIDLQLKWPTTPDKLTTLHTDVLLRIASFLSPADLTHCSRQCRTFYKVMRSPQLWQAHLTALYGEYRCTHVNHDPYDLYVQRGKAMLEVSNTRIGDTYMCTTCSCTAAFADAESLQCHQLQKHTEEWYSRRTLKDERITILKEGLITKRIPPPTSSRRAARSTVVKAEPLSPTLKPSAVGRTNDPLHPHQCLHCDFKTAKRERLYTHMENYHTQRCDLCDHQCLLHSELVQHIKDEHTVAELKAAIQRSKSSDPSTPVKQLNRVTYIALDQAVVHPCPHCKEAFDLKRNLRRHMRKQHKALLPPAMEPDADALIGSSVPSASPASSLELYVCEAYPACSSPDKTFYTANAFRLHMLSNHAIDNAFVCTQYQCCLYKNNTLGGLISHIQFHHNKKNQELNARLPTMKVRAQRSPSP